MPTTSPARTCSDTSIRSTPKGDSRFRLRPSAASTTAPGARAWCASAGGSAPIIMRLKDALLSSRGSHTPVTRPARITVQAVHSARISCSLWLM